MGTFIQAIIIVVREGLEALMLITALIAYAGNIGRPDHVRAIYAGIIAAIASSTAVAWIFHSAFATIQQTWADGLLVIGAAVLMLYVSGWLFIRRRTGAWQTYLHAKAEDALTRRAGYAIAAVAFIAVFREGMEVIVFVFALASTSVTAHTDIAAGLVAGAIALVAVFVSVRAVTSRLPLKLIFAATSALMFVMAIRFVGDAVGHLQVARHVSTTPIEGLHDFLGFGLDHTWEVVIVQLAVVTISLTMFAAFDRTQRDKVAL